MRLVQSPNKQQHIYQSEGGETVVMFAFGRNEGRGRVENVGVVLRCVWPSKLIGIGMYS